MNIKVRHESAIVKEEVHARYENKMPIVKIARHMGLSEYMVRRILSEKGKIKDPRTYDSIKVSNRKRVLVEQEAREEGKIYTCKCPGCGEFYKMKMSNWTGTGTPRIRHKKCPLPQAASGMYNGAGACSRSGSYGLI